MQCRTKIPFKTAVDRPFTSVHTADIMVFTRHEAACDGTLVMNIGPFSPTPSCSDTLEVRFEFCHGASRLFANPMERHAEDPAVRFRDALRSYRWGALTKIQPFSSSRYTVLIFVDSLEGATFPGHDVFKRLFMEHSMELFWGFFQELFVELLTCLVGWQLTPGSVQAVPSLRLLLALVSERSLSQELCNPHTLASVSGEPLIWGTRSPRSLEVHVQTSSLVLAAAGGRSASSVSQVNPHQASVCQW